MENLKQSLLNAIKSNYTAKDTESIRDINKFSKDLSEIEKEENKEATGAGSAGGYVGPLFGGEMSEEKLKGGKADKMTLLDIAKKHTKGKSKDTIKKVYNELKLNFQKGIKVEKEHTEDVEKVKEIAMDHLSEDPNYYDKLEKVEATEATGASSAGQYSGPSFLAKSQNKKDWRGASKPLYKGGKFVKIKKKCLKYPYCNQGDINALRLTELDVFENLIQKLALEYRIDQNILRKLINEEILKNNNN